jgi:hypothetical protein
MMKTRPRFCRLGTETRQKILECIDEIVTAMGQTDYEHFRAIVARAPTLLTNLARWSEVFGALRREDLISLIDRSEPAEQERMFQLMLGLREYLPMFGVALGQAAEMFPKSPGGHPSRLQDRESKREVCALVLKLIANGNSEAEAKRLAAKELVATGRVEKISTQTINRVWKNRAELERASFEEFLSQLLKSFSTNSAETSSTESDSTDSIQGLNSTK